MFDIYIRMPINKTAGLVTNQNECDDSLSLSQKKQFLLARLRQLEEGNKNKSNGNKIKALQTELSQINLLIKDKNKTSSYETNRINIELTEFKRLVCKELGEHKTYSLMDEARKNAKAYIYASSIS